MDQADVRERFARASVEKAEALTAMGQMEQALKELEDAYRLAPELVVEGYARALVQHAAQKEEAEDVEGALALYRRALQVAPEGSALLQEIAPLVYRLEAELLGMGTTGRLAARREVPAGKIVLWLVIMLAGWAGALDLSRFAHGNVRLVLVGWAAAGALVGLAQWLVARGVAPIKPWWILVVLVGWPGCFALGQITAAMIDDTWFVEVGRDVDYELWRNLWWSTAWQLAFLLNAVFNTAAVTLLCRSHRAES